MNRRKGGVGRIIRNVLLGLLAVVLVAGVGFYFWASQAAATMDEAIAALESDGAVQVSTSPWLEFRPVGTGPTTGLIFYPGGKVDPRAYAPAAHQMATAGYLVVIPSMPLNLAVLAPDKATDVIAAHPEIKIWALGGHSLGGTMAARYVYSHPDAAKGLVLWAAYPADSDSLAASSLAVLSISGTNDGLATPAKIEATRPLLPASTKYLPIAGGDHAQFGWYGPQDGDNPATISREEQQQQIVAATEELLHGLK